MPAASRRARARPRGRRAAPRAGSAKLHSSGGAALRAPRARSGERRARRQAAPRRCARRAAPPRRRAARRRAPRRAARAAPSTPAARERRGEGVGARGRRRRRERVEAESLAGDLAGRARARPASGARRALPASAGTGAELELDAHRLAAPPSATAPSRERAGRARAWRGSDRDRSTKGARRGRRLASAASRASCAAAARRRLAKRASSERERAGDGHLLHRVLGERDADRVADPVLEQRADPDRALDAAVLAVAGLGDADVERVARRAAARRSRRAARRAAGRPGSPPARCSPSC